MKIIGKFSLSNFTKREKVLIGIFIAILLELIFYLVFISPVFVKYKSINFKIEETKNEISTKNKIIENINFLNQKNDSMSKIDRFNYHKSFDEGNSDYINLLLKDIAEIQNVNSNEVNLTTDRKNISGVLEISKQYLVDSISIQREDEEIYSVYIKINDEKMDTRMPKVIKSEKKIDESINLKKEFLKSRIENKTSFSSEEQLTEKKIEKISNENSGKNSILDNNIKNSLGIDYENATLLYASKNNGSMFAKDNKDELVIYYELHNESGSNEILILFNQELELKNLKFKLYAPDNFDGEFGIYGREKISLKDKVKCGEVNDINIENVGDFVGIYYKLNEGERENGIFSVGDFEGML